MDIVFMAHYAGSPQHGMVYGHYYLAREWVRMGHKVTIIAAGFAHTRHRQPDLQSEPITFENVDGIDYLWIRVPKYRAADRLGRVRNILGFVAQTWLRRLPLFRADMVICSSHYPFAIHPARSLAKRLGAKLVFEVRDLWPLTLIELGGARTSHPFIRAMQWSEDYAYRTADSVVSVLENARDYMIAHGMRPNKFSFVPNGVDLSESAFSEPLSETHVAVLDRLRAEHSFLVGYAGRVGLANALQSLVGAAALCDGNDLHVVILGDGSHVVELRSQAERLGIADRVTFLGSVPKYQVNEFLQRMDVLYLGLQSQPLFRFGVSPTKLNDYMLAAKPIICAIDVLGETISEIGAGIGCAAEDISAIKNAIIALRRLNSEERREMGRRGYEWILANRDYRVLAERFLLGTAVLHDSRESARR